MTMENAMNEEPVNTPVDDTGEKVQYSSLIGKTTVTPYLGPDWTRDESTVQVFGKPRQFPYTQSGNAERLVARFGHQIRFCHSWHKWLLWNGQRWEPEGKAEIQALALRTARAIRNEVGSIVDDNENEKVKTALYFAKRSESKAELAAMIELAQAIDAVAVTSDQLDKDPYLFNCQNGTIDLRTGKLRPHTQGDLLTKISPVTCSEEAKCDRWLQFLGEVFAGDKELISFVQRALGCALTGMPEKAAFFLVGGGDNGKTTLLEAFRYIVADYADTVNINILMQASLNNEQQYAIAKLEGKRFVTASETKEGQALDEAKIKQLTGMGRIPARHPYGAPFSYDPQFKLFVDANHKPTIQGSDDAIWQRMQVIPFPVKFEEKQKDRTLRDKLVAEASGILAWAVKGCLEWQQRGLRSPKAVTEAVTIYREEMDIVGEFIEACCIVDPKATVTADGLYNRFKAWSQQRGEKPMGANGFGARLEAKGFKAVRDSGQRRRKGLRLKPFDVRLEEVWG